MSGPAPLDRPTFPSVFLDRCRSIVRRRAVPHGQHQRARLVLLLHESPRVVERLSRGLCGTPRSPQVEFLLKPQAEVRAEPRLLDNPTARISRLAMSGKQD